MDSDVITKGWFTLPPGGHLIGSTLSTNISVHEFPLAARYIGIISAAIIAFLGVIENTLTILTIITNRSLRRSSPNLFLANVSIADFLFCTIGLPPLIVGYIYGFNAYTSTSCRIVGFLQYVTGGFGISGISALTMNRYIKIVHPSIYQRMFRRNNVLIIIFGCWLTILILMSPGLFTDWLVFGWEEKTMSCTVLKEISRPYFELIMGLCFGIPSVCITVSYFHIYIKVRQIKRRISQHSKENCAHASQTKRKCLSRENKLTVTGVTIFGIFLITCLPYTTVTIFDKDLAQPILHQVAAALFWSPSCLNPIVYVFLNTQIRMYLKSMLMGDKAITHIRNTSTKQSSRKGWEETGETYI